MSLFMCSFFGHSWFLLSSIVCLWVLLLSSRLYSFLFSLMWWWHALVPELQVRPITPFIPLVDFDLFLITALNSLTTTLLTPCAASTILKSCNSSSSCNKLIELYHLLWHSRCRNNKINNLDVNITNTSKTVKGFIVSDHYLYKMKFHSTGPICQAKSIVSER